MYRKIRDLEDPVNDKWCCEFCSYQFKDNCWLLGGKTIPTGFCEGWKQCDDNFPVVCCKPMWWCESEVPYVKD